jgi:hypothetical protein
MKVPKRSHTNNLYFAWHLFHIHFSWYLQWQRCACVALSKCHVRHLPNFIFVVDPMLISTVARSCMHSYTYIQARWCSSSPHAGNLWVVNRSPYLVAPVLMSHDHGQSQRIDSTILSNFVQLGEKEEIFASIPSDNKLKIIVPKRLLRHSPSQILHIFLEELKYSTFFI